MGVRHLHELHCTFTPSQTKTGGNVFSLKRKRFFVFAPENSLIGILLSID